MASSPALPEPMNSSPHHSKVKVTITLPDPTFVAGEHVSGKVEMECRADRGLGIGIMMVELFAIQELTSRDHSATSTFLHSRRLFQGPGLPPSNAVQAHPMPGDPILPQHYHQARKGRSTFLFRIPIPASSPSSITFGAGLAKVVYELRASVGVFWKDEKRLVVDRRRVDVVQAYPYDDVLASMGKLPEAIVVGENGKLWMQGKVGADVIVAGDSACLELQVKNHSNKKNSGLTLSLIRTLYLPSSIVGPQQQQRQAPLQISDTLTTVPYRGPEYIIPPGAEGVANLVFDIPDHARGVRGGTLDGEEMEDGTGPRRTEALFEVRCKVEVKLSMGMGSKDIILEIPIEIVHPSALPSHPLIHFPYPLPYATTLPDALYADYHRNPYYPPPAPAPAPVHPLSPLSPGPGPGPGTAPAPAPGLAHIPYVDTVQNQVWMPPPPSLPLQTQTEMQTQTQTQMIPVQPHDAQGYPYYHPLHHPQTQTPAPLDGYHPHSQPQPHPHPHIQPNIQSPYALELELEQQLQGYDGRADEGLGLGYLSPGPNPLHPHPYLDPQTQTQMHPDPDPNPDPPYTHNPHVTQGVAGLPIVVGAGIHALSHPTAIAAAAAAAGGGVTTTTTMMIPVIGSDPENQQHQQHQHQQEQEQEQEQEQKQRRYPRSLPPPPPLLLNAGAGPVGMGMTAAGGGGGEGVGGVVVHSPRPQLTPKHSLTFIREVAATANGNDDDGDNDGDEETKTKNQNQNQNQSRTRTRARSKSERVEELEKMADEVEKKSRDLSCDLPKGISDILAVALARSRSAKEEEEGEEGDGNIESNIDINIDINKSLPGPPVPSGKHLLQFGSPPPLNPPPGLGLPGLPGPGPARARARADVYFAERNDDALHYHDQHDHPETTPLPSDQTPPTPALLAVHPSRSSRLHTQRGRQQQQGQQGHGQGQRQENKNDLKTESGLDALERRLLAEVGTRKMMDMDSHRRVTKEKEKEKGKGKERRPDVRDVLSVVEEGGSTTNRTRTSSASMSMSMSIPNTTKSPETLHDSAISSLTLAGGMGGDESEVEQEQEQEQEFDGRTHRAGKSRAGSGDEDEDEEDEDERGRLTSGGGGGGAAVSGNGLHFHMRERAQAVSTPTKTLNLERVRSGGVGVGGNGAGQRDQDSREDVDSGKSREGKSSGKKKDRSSKSAAKGRVAAWLGGIDPDVPPQEQIIPPSPSVCQAPASPFAVGQDVDNDTSVRREGLPGFAEEVPPEVSAPPNPRSSGFVPIATLKKNTLPTRPLIAKDATVVEEAKRVQDIWASANEDTPLISAQEMPQFFKAFQPAAPGPMSIHTNRRVSPPSSSGKPPPPDPRSKPLSYSAVAKTLWKSPEVASKPVGVLPPVPPPKTPISPAPKKIVQSQTQQGVGRVPGFPPPTKLFDPEVRYDIRSARGGRGGKVTAVANLWASGAINNNINTEQAKGKGVSRLVVDSATPAQPHPASAPPLPPRAGKKLFSDAVLTPALPPKRTPTATAVVAGKADPVARPTDAQKRPDARAAFFSPPNPKSVSTSTGAIASGSKSPPPPAVGPTNAVHPVSKKLQSANTPLVSPPPAANKLGAMAKGSKSTEALVLLQKRPATAMSSPSASRPHGKTTPTSLSTPSSSHAPDPSPNHRHNHKLPAVHSLVANLNLNSKGVGNVNYNLKNRPKPKPKPVMYKGTSDPAVVSSSHAVPVLSSTASLARPHDPLVAPSSSSSSSGGGGGVGVLSSSAAAKLPLNNNVNLVPPRISSGLGLGLGLGLPVDPENVQDGVGPGARRQLARPASPSKPVSVVPDLAIGQARIRDLIKKYQGQAGGGGGQVGQRT